MSDDHTFRDQLPSYAAAISIGSDAEALAPGFAAHLAICPDCAADLQELLELAQPAYAGEIEPAARHPAADLTFLEATMQLPQPTAPAWAFDAGRLVICFSEALLAGMRRQPLVGAARSARGQLIYRYTQEPGSLHDLDVSVEVYAEDAAQKHGRVRVGVDVASRGPLDQSGSLVTLSLGELNWRAETDETGCVDFAPVPLEELPSLRVEITPLDSDED
jgi:hypothetical protein